MPICCLCGEPLEALDAGLMIFPFRVIPVPSRKRNILKRTRMEDGSLAKFVHTLCPAQFGVPRAMIGAELPDV